MSCNIVVGVNIGMYVLIYILLKRSVIYSYLVGVNWVQYKLLNPEVGEVQLTPIKFQTWSPLLFKVYKASASSEPSEPATGSFWTSKT